MHKRKRISTFVPLLMALLMVSACQSAPGQEVSGQEVSSAPQLGSFHVESSSTAQSSQQNAALERPIPGIDADNYPIIDGSTANHPLIAQIYETLCGVSTEDAQTMVSLNLGSTGSLWVNFVLRTRPDMLIAYEAPESVYADYAQELAQLEIEPLGRDGLVFLVNKDNPVESLTTEQLRKIYTGEITDWSEVGGAPGAIQPFQRNDDSGSQTLFLKLLMQDLTPMSPPTELLEVSMGALIDGVANFDGSGSALGYSVYYYADLMYANPDLKILAVDGVTPSKESIADGSYPLVNDFYTVIRADEPADSLARQVRDWLLSPAGRQLLEETNYVWARDDR